MRLLSAMLAVACIAANASAQIYKIDFKDPKSAKKYKAHCVEVNDELLLVGEIKAGATLNEARGVWELAPTIEMWVADMDSPRQCPYKVVKGQKVKAGSKATASLNRDDVDKIVPFMLDQSFYGLTKEYGGRLDEIDELKKQRDALKKGTPEWKAKQTAVIQSMERLRSWLESTIYAKTARKVKREIDAEMKLSKEANAQRLELAKQSIKLVPTPEDLSRAGKQVYGDAVVLKVGESQHIRIVYREESGDDRVKALLELGENLIEGFRVQFIDPYIKDDYKDYLPDGMFAEYYFAPDDIEGYIKFMQSYYGTQFDERSVQWLREKKTNGSHSRRGSEPSYLHSSITAEQSDMEGVVAHAMGHHLVNLHYNQDRRSEVGPWLNEGVANWLSLEYLGRNSVQCVSFDVGKYAKKRETETGESALRQGTADIYHRLALDEGASIDVLALKPLSEFADPDIAKSYSLYNFIAKTQGEKGQRWLRTACNAAAVPGQMIPQWRKKSEEIFEVSGLDIFKKVNDEWVAFAKELIGAR